MFITNKYIEKRYDITIEFLKKELPIGSKILDLGISNPLSERMIKEGYIVQNTPPGLDLDLNWDVVKKDGFDAITAFEIFEHLICPFNLLKDIKAPMLIASVPLNVWFSPAHWSDKVEWDCHYHEFESRQFDRLLAKSGWIINKGKKFKAPHRLLGIRPILRRFFNHYYIVSALKNI